MKMLQFEAGPGSGGEVWKRVAGVVEHSRPVSHL